MAETFSAFARVARLWREIMAGRGLTVPSCPVTSAWSWHHVHPEQPLVHLDAVQESRPFVEGVERQLLDERDPVHQDVVALGSELNIPCFLAAHDRSHVRIGHAHGSLSERGYMAFQAAIALGTFRYFIVGMFPLQGVQQILLPMRPCI